jgi:hypothetical protein
MQLLSGLLAAGVPGGDIGIISPYKAQVGAVGGCGTGGQAVQLVDKQYSWWTSSTAGGQAVPVWC